MEKVFAVQVRTHNHTPRTDVKVETRVMVAACNPTSQEVETEAPGTTWLIRQTKKIKKFWVQLRDLASVNTLESNPAI